MGPGDLSEALAPLPRHHDPRILVGHESFDDAGVFRLSDDLALVQTVDFFAPIVDDPYAFGQIAAANALSDIYAMGGVPLTALCIAGFPVGVLPLAVLTEILRGGQAKVHEAGASIVGGHTVTDTEVKYGLSITGQVHPDRMLTNAAAAVGDALVLTKPLGTGLLATAAKQGSIPAEAMEPAIQSMSVLNAQAAKAAVELGLRCATDVTGFGLLGHALHIARASKVTLEFHVTDVPLLPGTRQAAGDGVSSGGAERNDAWLAEQVAWGGVSRPDRAILVDPQTSGGLLLSVPAPLVAEYLSRVPGAVVIGSVVGAQSHAIALRA